MKKLETKREENVNKRKKEKNFFYKGEKRGIVVLLGNNEGNVTLERFFFRQYYIGLTR